MQFSEDKIFIVIMQLIKTLIETLTPEHWDRCIFILIFRYIKQKH